MDLSGTHPVVAPIGKPENGHDGTKNVHIFSVPLFFAAHYNVSFGSSFVVQGIEIVDASRIRGPIIRTSGIRGEIMAGSTDLTGYYLDFSIILTKK